ncbi:MAG TPA: ROK family protein [Actinomycetaceae bacterium]|nr:ROK family protein [Actinomycetaceae bacterium]
MVLQRLFHAGSSSRSDLAEETGLTRVTVSDLIKDLIDERLVEELGQRPPSIKGGKPATLVGLRTDSYQMVAVDLLDDGNMHGALLDLNGSILKRRRSTQAPTGEAGIAALAEFCRELIALAAYPILGVGISSPGVIDDSGTIIQADNRGWFDLPLATILTETLGVPTQVANDANVSALGEFTFGGATGSGLLALTIGRGVGAGIILDGALLLGQRHAVGEIGHVMTLDERDAGPGSPLGPPCICACGRYGCLETILSVPSLRERTHGVPPDAADAALAAVGHRLGIVLAPVVSALNLTEIVLCGPDELLGGTLRENALETIRERTLPFISRDLRMRMTGLGEDGPLAGAAVLVLSGRLGVS